MIRQYDSEYKLALVGVTGAGKSSIYNRFIYNIYDNSYSPTIGVIFQFRTLQMDAKRIRLEIRDTAGQERYQSIASLHYRGCHAILFVFDLSDKVSFEATTHFWYNQAIKFVDQGTLAVLVGSKSDLPRKVSEDIRKQFCELKGMKYFQCSAKDNKGCQDILTQIVRDLEEKSKKKMIKQVQNEGVVRIKAKKQKSKCC